MTNASVAFALTIYSLVALAFVLHPAQESDPSTHLGSAVGCFLQALPNPTSVREHGFSCFPEISPRTQVRCRGNHCQEKLKSLIRLRIRDLHTGFPGLDST